MRGNLNLNQLAQEITRQAQAKKDYIAPTCKIGAHVVNSPEQKGDLRFRLNGESLPLTDHAHSQVAARLGIPKKYYDRLRSDHPDLLAHDVRGLMEREPQNVMVRTLDGRVRAVLSDRFRPLDNDLMLEAALPVIRQAGSLEIRAIELSEKRLYLQVVDVKLEGQVKPGDVVQAGFCLSNSEVGAGAVSVEELIWRLVCSNGMIAAKALRRNHVGSRIGGDDEQIAAYYESDTQEAVARAFLLKLRDTLKHVLSREAFENRLYKLRSAAQREIDRPLSEVVEVTAKRFGYTQTQSESVLQHLAAGGDFTAWGLANAITRTAQDQDPDTAYQMERDGSQIIEMTASDWRDHYTMAKAA